MSILTIRRLRNSPSGYARNEKFGGKPCAVVELWKGDTDTVSLSTLFGMKGVHPADLLYLGIKDIRLGPTLPATDRLIPLKKSAADRAGRL